VNLASTFFAILIVLTAFAFLLRYGSRWFLPVQAGQSLIIAAAGERMPIIVGTVGLLVLMTRAGVRPSTRSLYAALGLTMVGALAITGVRAEQGRTLYEENTSLQVRVAALRGGLVAGVPITQLGAQFAARLDATSFTAAILQDEHFGQPALSASYVPESLLLLVPSELWPSKLAHGQGVLSPYDLEISTFDIQNANLLPGLTGLYSGYLPWYGLMALMALLGLFAGYGERWLLRECTPARIILLTGAVTAAGGFEEGLPGMLTELRSAVALVVVFKLIQVARGRTRGGWSADRGHPVARADPRRRVAAD
jgi:hypothetical protein